MAKKRIAKEARADKNQDDKKLYAFLATFLSIIGFVIALIIKRDDKYVMFYAKQSLVVFIVGAVAGVLRMFFWIFPIIGWIIAFALNVIVLLLWLVSWIYALSGEMKEVPVVGHYGRKFDL